MRYFLCTEIDLTTKLPYLHRVQSPYDRDEIVRRAKAKIGCSKYSLTSYNCEHFVNEVKYNKPVSEQVKLKINCFILNYFFNFFGNYTMAAVNLI